jgi:hypothetical protein
LYTNGQLFGTLGIVIPIAVTLDDGRAVRTILSFGCSAENNCITVFLAICVEDFNKVIPRVIGTIQRDSKVIILSGGNRESSQILDRSAMMWLGSYSKKQGLEDRKSR